MASHSKTNEDDFHPFRFRGSYKFFSEWASDQGSRLVGGPSGLRPREGLTRAGFFFLKENSSLGLMGFKKDWKTRENGKNKSWVLGEKWLL